MGPKGVVAIAVIVVGGGGVEVVVVVVVIVGKSDSGVSVNPYPAGRYTVV